jgi:hypothetical protein
MGGGSDPQWGAGGQELFYVSPGSKLMSVKLKVGTDSIEPSAPRELFSMAGGYPRELFSMARGYRVAPDGKRFLVLRRNESGPQPLQIILNWPALLNQARAD